MLGQLGISGPDLTVRPGGLVNPERVEQDLPEAFEIFKEHGMGVPMITTAITSANDPPARPLLATAARLGIRYFKPGYYRYADMNQWRPAREAAHRQLAGVVQLAKELGLRAGFHLHSGPVIGGTAWDALELLQDLDPQVIGLYFDPSHATIEGGSNGWNFSFRRAVDRITMVSIKDFVWEKVKGRWRTSWVPLGQGMVRFAEFFGMLAKVPFPGPLSLHIEYDPGGATKTQRYDRALEAAVRDLQVLRQLLKAAYV
jgi:sugar phosphate isomerase/epimerase